MIGKEKKSKKHGSRGGVREWLKKRGSRHPLPIISLSNVRALQNKMDELMALVRFDGDFRRSSLMCFTDTWLTEDTDNSLGPGFTTIHADREWVVDCACLPVTVGRHSTACVNECVPVILSCSWPCHSAPSIYQLEFCQITVILVYVPGATLKTAAFNEAVSRSVDQPVFILGDFNFCDLSPHLPTLQQYITCPTRLNRTIDMSYGSIESAYRPVCRPPLGRSDHNVAHLLPKYRQKVKTEGTQTKSCQLWTQVMDSWLV